MPKMACRSTANGPANGQIFDHWGCRSTGRSTAQGNLPVGQPSGRSRPEPESELSGRSTRARSRDQALWIGRPHGRPAQWPEPCARLVNIGRPLGRLRSDPVDWSVDRQCSQAEF